MLKNNSIKARATNITTEKTNKQTNKKQANKQKQMRC